jgi:hypothetical protein
MARRNKMSVLKLQRERKKAEKAATKREAQRVRREGAADGAGTEVATNEDLEGYGIERRPGGDGD